MHVIYTRHYCCASFTVVNNVLFQYFKVAFFCNIKHPVRNLKVWRPHAKIPHALGTSSPLTAINMKKYRTLSTSETPTSQIPSITLAWKLRAD